MVLQTRPTFPKNSWHPSYVLHSHSIILKLNNELPLIERIATLLTSMHTIKTVSQSLLNEKLKDAALVASSDDMNSKKDIMSLLVKARKAEDDAQESEKKAFAEVPAAPAYRMTDRMLMDQVVSISQYFQWLPAF
jgi:hypothetical protein